MIVIRHVLAHRTGIVLHHFDRTHDVAHSTPLQTSELRSVDRELLMAMRGNEWVSMNDLIESLGVTTTAVRQRLDRVLAMGLVDREKVVAGRGRPTYQYRLTIAGHQSAGANPADIANAMWLEILAIPDSEVRTQLVSSIAARLGREYAAQMAHVRSSDTEDTFDQRMQRLSELLASRNIMTDVSQSGQLPVLDICVCPYPTMTDASDDRSMCRLEEQMFSEALGVPIELSSCRLDGDASCKFSPIDVSQSSSQSESNS